MDDKNRRGIPLHNDDKDKYSHLDIVASSTECTGLIPAPPANESEAESYADLYSIPKPENDSDNGFQHE